jgi:hypothetical protein
MFDFSSPELRVSANSILRCSGSNPAAPASQSVSNASLMKVAQKPRGNARFAATGHSNPRASPRLDSGTTRLTAGFSRAIVRRFGWVMPA